MVGNSYLQISQAHDKREGMLKCEATFSRIGLLISWVSPEQREAF